MHYLDLIPRVGPSGGWEAWAGVVPTVTVYPGPVWRVDLSPLAIAIAERVACERQRRNREDQRVERNRPRAVRDHDAQLEDHRVGVYGEVAVAGALGIVYRGPVDRPVRAPDIGNVHVKATRLAHGHLLIQRDEQDLDLPFLLCTAEGMRGSPVMIVLRGWIYGHEAPNPSDPKATGRPARWVPQSSLRPVDTLPGLGVLL